MSKHNIFELKDRDTISDALTEMLRTGANQLIHQAVQIELEELLAANVHRLTPDGNAAVVRNGYQPQREILTGIGPVTVKLPKVRSKDGEVICFHSAQAIAHPQKSKRGPESNTSPPIPGPPEPSDSCLHSGFRERPCAMAGTSSMR